jgi:hydroxylaminobenzene mutase
VDVLAKIGLFELAVAGLSGWLILFATQNPNWFRSRGVPVPHRFLQAHIDLIMMSLILIAVGAVAGGAPDWIKALVAFGAIVNPLLFVPLAWGPKVAEKAVYRGITVVSFTTLSVGLPALAIWAA